MILHYVSSITALTALVLYADRSGRLFAKGRQGGWALLTRASIGMVFASVAVGFLALALAGADFEWRHWLVLGACSGVVTGHIGLRVTNSPHF